MARGRRPGSIGACLVRDALRAVRREESAVLIRSGDELRYDSLLLAIGAQARPALQGALTFRGAPDVPAMRALLADVDAGRVTRVAFVVPSRSTWTLPLYELALLTAERARLRGRFWTRGPHPRALAGRRPGP
jgi:sulfide:quinone oxidoreductase